jgi:stress responsive alpha/beta barrel protein
MLRHVVCLTWKPGTAPAAVEAVQAALEALPGLIPEIRAYAVGTDLGLADGNAGFGIVADFEDAGAWRTYQAHPEHVRVITELIRPHLEARTAVQFDVPSA